MATEATPHVTLTVPRGFELPGFYTDASPATVARVLALGPSIIELGASAGSADADAALAALREKNAALQRERASLTASAGERAVELAAPLVQQAREASSTEAAELRAQLGAAREQCAAEAGRGAAMDTLHEDLRGLQHLIRGSTNIKGTMGETQVLTQMAMLCPDSHVEEKARSDHCGDGLWLKHFGSAHLSMRCMTEVKNVERLRAEEFTKFFDDIDTQARVGSVNSAMLVSLKAAPLPLAPGRVRYCAYFTLDWRGNIPVIMVSNIASNPDLLSVAMATMQHVWQFGERVGALGPSQQGGETEDRVRAMATLVNNFVNEQFGIHSQELALTEKTARHLSELTRDNERRARLAQNQIENISARLSEALGEWVHLRETAPEQDRKRRRRGGAATPYDAMTADQRAVVDACIAWCASGTAAAPRELRAANVNAGKVAGVTKHHVDTLFGNFSSLKLSVAAETASRAGGD